MPALSDNTVGFARIPPALALASGLFVSRSRAHARTGNGVQCLARFDASEGSYGFYGQAALGSDDLRVLQAIFLLASQPGPSIALAVQAPGGAVGQRLAGGLNATGNLAGAPQAKIVTTAIHALADAAGYVRAAGGSRTVVGDALERLAQIEVRFKNDAGTDFNTRLIAKTPVNPAQDGIGSANDTLAIAIAPVFSEGLISKKPARFVRIGADEIAALGRLNADSARASILHMRLCGFIDPGKTRSVCVEKLAIYLFGETLDTNTRRRQCADVRRTFPGLESIGWGFERYASHGRKQIYRIFRQNQD